MNVNRIVALVAAATITSTSANMLRSTSMLMESVATANTAPSGLNLACDDQPSECVSPCHQMKLPFDSKHCDDPQLLLCVNHLCSMSREYAGQLIAAAKEHAQHQPQQSQQSQQPSDNSLKSASAILAASDQASSNTETSDQASSNTETPDALDDEKDYNQPLENEDEGDNKGDNEGGNEDNQLVVDSDDEDNQPIVDSDDTQTPDANMKTEATKIAENMMTQATSTIHALTAAKERQDLEELQKLFALKSALGEEPTAAEEKAMKKLKNLERLEKETKKKQAKLKKTRAEEAEEKSTISDEEEEIDALRKQGLFISSAKGVSQMMRSND